MDTFSTEIISKSYSSLSGQNKYEFNRIDTQYSINKKKSSEAEEFIEKDMSFTNNASNPTIEQLSAQVMNLPYNEYNENITNETFESPKKCSLKEYDILKRIKEAYDACSCKICRCLMGPTITPRDEYCDCEPCKCKDCTLNNLRFNIINVQSRARNENIYRDSVQETSCDCKPCNCMECTQNCGFRSKSVNYVGNKIVKNETKNTTAEKNSLQKKYPTHDMPIGIKKLLGRPITTNTAYSNKRCECSKCECIICESQRNALTCYSSLRYGDKPFQKLTCPDTEWSKCATCQNQPTRQSIDNANCECDMCHYAECVRNSEPQNYLNKRNPDINHGGSNEPLIDRIMHEKPVKYECNEYAHDKFRCGRGSIFYVNSVTTYDPTKITLRPNQPRIKENKVGLPFTKENNHNSKIKSQSKSIQFVRDSTVLTAVFNTNAVAPKNSLNNVSAVFDPRLNILEDLPINNVHKTSSYSFSSGFNSARTITASSVLSYQNKACSKRTISLPDTIIYDNLPEIGSKSNISQVRKFAISNYRNQHNIYHCSNIESDCIKIVRQLQHKYPSDIENRVAGNVLFDRVNQFFTKRCKVEQTNTDNFNSVHKTVLNAKQFTINLTKILHKYEKANLEFKSVSKKLKKSLYMILNGLSTSKCDCILKQTADVGEKNKTKNFEVVNQTKLKNVIEENKSIAVKAKKIINIDKNNHLNKEEKVFKKITKVKNDSQNNIENVSDETDDTINRKILIKSAFVDQFHVHGITGQEPVASEVELLRAKKIRDILKQNMMLDLFTE